MAKTKHYNKLSPAELERLAKLAEECGEVIHAINRIILHGYHDKKANRNNLEKECGDVRACMIRLCNAGDLSKDRIHRRASYKLKHQKNLHHQG